MKKILLILFGLIICVSTINAQYQFHNTYQNKEGTFASPETYFADMNNTDVIVGHYLNPANERSDWILLLISI
jgi:hypothetical protein